MSLRRVRPDGLTGDLVGYVLDSDAVGIRLRDRRDVTHEVAWADVLAWRLVGVARGRDPLRAPIDELDRLAEEAGVSGRVLVARLSSVLDGRPVMASTVAPPCPARVDGEWVTAGACTDYLALSWWAARADARSIQVRTDDPSTIGRLLNLGFAELVPPPPPEDSPLLER